MTRRRCVLPAGVAVLLWLSMPASGRQVFRSGVDAVFVDVLVTDSGRPVEGLAASDFELRDNGVVQRVELMARNTHPITVMLALDVSESVVGEPLGHLRDAVDAAAALLAPEDRLSLLTFSDRVRLVSPPTREHARVRDAVRSVAAGGATSLYDATFAALAIRQQAEGRVVIVVFSDGADTTSWLDPREVLDAAHRSDVVVYGVTLGAAVPTPDAAAVLRSRLERRQFRDDPVRFRRHYLSLLAEDTGGALLIAERSDELRETFVRAIDEFRRGYVLTYTPSNVEPDGWHEIRVEVKNRRADVRARRGYLRGPAAR